MVFSRLAWHQIQEYSATERYPRYLKQVFDFPHSMLANIPRGKIYPKLRAKVDFNPLFMQIFSDFIKIFLGIIITFFVIYSRNIYFAFGFLIVWIISAYSLYLISKSRVDINVTANEAWDEHQGKLSDILGNVETATLFGSQKWELKNFHKQGKELWAKFTVRWIANRKYQNTISGINLSMNILIMIIGIWSVANGKITIGTFVLLQTYVAMAMQDIISFSDQIRTFIEETTRAISLDELTDEHPSLPEPTNPAIPNKKATSIEFRNVNFKYSDGKDTALKDFNLIIKSGEKVGIVGKSGAGKTTITKLLLRMYQPSSGDVLIGGVNIEDMGTENTRSCISYVPQEPILFHRSIKENIAYAKPEASDTEIKKAAKQSHCLEFINKIDEGFDAKVGDKGVKLSGGQRQRVAIARAILKNSPVLIFDEATSALDSESESIIQDALINVMKNKTSIVIAHRLSTLKHMDRIVVIDDGRVVEDGTHQELLNKDGIYAKLWNQQSGGFLQV